MSISRNHLLLILITAVLFGCSSTHNKPYHNSSIKAGAFDQGTRILITHFSPTSIPVSIDHEELSSGRLSSHYRVSIYDITNDTRYLGSLDYQGSYQRPQWIEHQVSAGIHRLMLLTESSFNPEIDTPYYSASNADVIEVVTKENESTYVAVAKYSQRVQASFYQLTLDPKHAKYCENFPEHHYSKKAAAIKFYMAENNIDKNSHNFFRFCKLLGEQKRLISPNGKGKTAVREHASTVQFSREQAVKDWNSEKGRKKIVVINNL